jgi:hypothetical protein
VESCNAAKTYDGACARKSFLCRLEAEVDGLGVFPNDDAPAGIVAPGEEKVVGVGGRSHSEVTRK